MLVLILILVRLTILEVTSNLVFKYEFPITPCAKLGDFPSVVHHQRQGSDAEARTVVTAHHSLLGPAPTTRY